LPKSTIGVSRARDIAGALEERGYDVIFAANPTNAGGRASLRDFSVKTSGADLAIAVLVGHGIATGGQTYFLPANTEISRATDLMSRGLAVANIAQIVSRAKQGGVFFFMTVPSFPQAMEGLDSRPQYASDVLPNVVATISNSPRIPLSRVDGAGMDAASAFAEALRTPGSSLADAARVAAAGDLGFVVGTAPPVDLSGPAPAAEQPAAPPAADLARQAEDAAKQAETEAKLRAERLAREAAEKKARDEEGRVQVLQSETQKAQADSRKAQADLARAQAEAQKAQSEAQRAQAEAQKALAEAERTKAEADKARRDALAEAQKAEQARRDAIAEAERIRKEAASSAEQAKQEALSSAEKAKQEALAEAERVRTQAKALEDQAAFARAEADRAKEAKERAEADAAQKLAALATQAAQPQPQPQPAVQPPPPAAESSRPSIPLDEAKLGQDQRRRIQEKLRDIGLYSGKVDGNLGPMTREAIGWYQKSRGVAETGFLTLDQYQALLAAD
jgi:hypothetical protein